MFPFAWLTAFHSLGSQLAPEEERAEDTVKKKKCAHVKKGLKIP
jgi:hypothetical protein